jgi:hypothetical protein
MWTCSSDLLIDFIIIPILFYIVLAASGSSIADWREDGWLFDMSNGKDAKWYEFYTYLGECALYTLFLNY